MKKEIHFKRLLTDPDENESATITGRITLIKMSKELGLLSLYTKIPGVPIYNFEYYEPTELTYEM